MGDAHGTTLSFHEDGKSGRVGPRPEPVLVLVLECGRPRAGSVRYRLSELTGVALGRGAERRAEVTGNELTVRVPDKWMSSRHARIEPSFGRWVLTDADSKNGTFVNGQPTKRTVLADGDLVELGHTLFVFCERLPLAETDPAIIDLEESPDLGSSLAGMATLIPAPMTIQTGERLERPMIDQRVASTSEVIGLTRMSGRSFCTELIG